MLYIAMNKYRKNNARHTLNAAWVYTPNVKTSVKLLFDKKHDPRNCNDDK